MARRSRTASACGQTPFGFVRRGSRIRRRIFTMQNGVGRVINRSLADASTSVAGQIIVDVVIAITRLFRAKIDSRRIGQRSGITGALEYLFALQIRLHRQSPARSRVRGCRGENAGIALIVILSVLFNSQRDLFQIAGTRGAPSVLASTRKSREKYRRENGNDSYNNEQFYQSKCGPRCFGMVHGSEKSENLPGLDGRAARLRES